VRALLTDLRQSLRALVREFRFTSVAVVALAVGIGSATAMFSVLDAALLRPLPYVAADRLLQLLSVDGSGQRVPMGAVEFLELAKRSRTAEVVAAVYRSPITVQSGKTVRTLHRADVSSSIFATLGIRPALGRAFEPAEDFAGRPAVTILSDAYWRREMNGDPDVLGRTIQVEHQSAVVVGVLPRGAVIPRAENAELFFPLGITAQEMAVPAARSGLYGFARLEPGVSLASARSEMDSIVRATSGYGIALEPLQRALTAQGAPALRAAFAATVLLLLLACANVALLLLLRATSRARDLAIRAALGGGRRRIASQHVMEGVLLAAAGGAAGLLCASLVLQAVIALAPPGIPRLHEVRVDARMAVFAVLASLTSGALAGAASAFRALHSELLPLLNDGGAATASGSRSRFRDALVVAQIALALVLATGTGLLLRSLQRFASVPLGFEPQGVQAAFVYPRRDLQLAPVTEVLAKVRALPGIQNAAFIGYLPMDALRGGGGWDAIVHVEGRSPSATAPDVAAINWLTPGFVATAGIRLLKGRDLEPADDSGGAPVALINEAFASRYLSGREPIGALFSSAAWNGITFRVVGVVGDMRQWGPAHGSLPEAYLPQDQFLRNAGARGNGAMLVVKTTLPEASVDAAVRAAVEPFDQLSIDTIRPLGSFLDFYFAERRFQLGAATAFALAAIALAAIGVYGAMAFSVVQRRRELAVRAALGAGKRELFRLVLARGVWLAAAGICLGAASALALSRFLSAILFGIGARDPVTFVAAIATLGTVAIAASLIPARAASRLDPMTILRRE